SLAALAEAANGQRWQELPRHFHPGYQGRLASGRVISAQEVIGHLRGLLSPPHGTLARLSLGIVEGTATGDSARLHVEERAEVTCADRCVQVRTREWLQTWQAARGEWRLVRSEELGLNRSHRRAAIMPAVAQRFAREEKQMLDLLSDRGGGTR